MRLVSMASDSQARAAVVRPDGRYVDLQRTDASLPTDMAQLLALGRDGLQRAAAAMAVGDAIDPAGVKLLAPVPRPEKIFLYWFELCGPCSRNGKRATAGNRWCSANL